MGKKSLDSIEKEIEEKLNAALKKTATDVTFEIEMAYESAIDAFYSDYYPHQYDRTGATYYASNAFNGLLNSINNNLFESLTTPFDDGYMAGIEVDPHNIQTQLGHPYRANTMWVFPRTYLKGIHGYTLQESRQWTQRYNKKTGIRNNAVFRFPSDMTVMKKKPVTLMEQEVKKITKKKHIDELFIKNIK